MHTEKNEKGRFEKLWKTAGLVLGITLAATAGAQDFPIIEFDEGSLGEAFYVSSEEPILDLEVLEPISVELPYAEEGAEIAWVTEGDAAIFVQDDTSEGWRLQEPNGDLTYWGAGRVAVLPDPGAGASLFFGFRNPFADVKCGGPVKGSDAHWTIGKFNNVGGAITYIDSLIKPLADDNIKDAVKDFECPDICPNKSQVGRYHKVTDHNVIYLGPFSGPGHKTYFVKAFYNWSSFVRCSP